MFGINHSVVCQDEHGRWLVFREPRQVLATRSSAGVVPILAQAEQAADSGAWAVGFLTYEAAPAFDPAFRCHPGSGLPLAWFGVFATPPDVLDVLPSDAAPFEVGEWRPSETEDEYRAAIARIREYIRAGDTYQVNYTTRLRAAFSGNARSFFLALVRSQRSGCCAFIETPEFAICSASPELFFERDGDRVFSRPMKGTLRRGLTWDQDEQNRLALQGSGKNRAENVMIVDMIRNDLGRVARPGSVAVTRPFEVERYPTVLQMTSTVEARCDVSTTQLLSALFPCASITGAPKVRTMEIIRELETEPRELYTGAIGYLAPGRRARFNVAIRTVVVDTVKGQAAYGVGGGIVWESDPGEEFNECRAKARVLTAGIPEFDLFETILWTPETGLFLMEKHRDRLRKSAEYFGFRYSDSGVDAALRTAIPKEAERQGGDLRIRLRLHRSGRFTAEGDPFEPKTGAFRVALAADPVSSDNVFLYHKTTYRRVYADAKATRAEWDDVLLWNERGELTESTIANLVLEFDGKRFTPPVSAGLLAGAFRAHLLERGEMEERTLRVEDLKRARKVWLINSVRQWIPAIVDDRRLKTED